MANNTTNQNVNSNGTSGTEYDYDYGNYPDYSQLLLDQQWLIDAVARVDLFQKIWPPIVILVGTIGNMISLVVLLQKNMRTSSTCIYLAFLAVADTLFLYTGALDVWIRGLTQKSNSAVDMRLWTGCHLFYFLNFFGSHFASWLLVVVTLERFVGIYFPIKSHIYCSTRIAKIVVLVLALVIFLINVVHLVIWKASLPPQEESAAVDVNGSSQTSTERMSCYGISKGANNFITKVLPWIDAILYSYLPVVVIFSLNTLIICRMYNVSCKICKKGKVEPTTLQKSSLSSHANRTTRMLLVVSTSFLVTTAPSVLVKLMTEMTDINNTETRNKLSLANSVVLFPLYVNHSINFFLYCLTGQKFRHELRKVFHCKSNRVDPLQQDNSTLVNKNSF